MAVLLIAAVSQAAASGMYPSCDGGSDTKFTRDHAIEAINQYCASNQLPGSGAVVVDGFYFEFSATYQSSSSGWSNVADAASCTSFDTSTMPAFAAEDIGFDCATGFLDVVDGCDKNTTTAKTGGTLLIVPPSGICTHSSGLDPSTRRTLLSAPKTLALDDVHRRQPAADAQTPPPGSSILCPSFFTLQRKSSRAQIHAPLRPVIPRGLPAVLPIPSPTTNRTTAVKVANLQALRASAQIPRKSIRCLQGSAWAGREAAARYFASAVSTPSRTPSSEAVPPELAGAPSTERPQRRQAPTTGVSSGATRQHLSYPIPSVVIPAEAAKNGPVHKIHILGEDARSRFIAHALSGVYESVSLLGYRDMPKSRYNYVEKTVKGQPRRQAKVELSPTLNEESKDDGKSHIDHLVVSGRGFEAVKAVESVKDRVNKDTTICLMNDGMGVHETITEKVFTNPESAPKIVLGHMSHHVHLNKSRSSVKELYTGRTILTEVNPDLEAINALRLSTDRMNMIQKLGDVKSLHSTPGTYDEWLRFKLPPMIFTAAVEPVCVLLNLSYREMLGNKHAKHIMMMLVSEIATLVDNLPEIQHATKLRKYIRSPALKEWLYRRLKSKGDAPSDLVKRLERGLPTDVKYQNGYFLQRARSLGIEMPVNHSLTQMIKGKRRTEATRLRNEIPVEETSAWGTSSRDSK